MKNRPSAAKGPRQVPLDHLRPGSRPARDADTGASSRAPEELPERGAEPADAVTPGGGHAEATRGKATRSPASVAERPHLEGSEQGPS